MYNIMLYYCVSKYLITPLYYQHSCPIQLQNHGLRYHKLVYRNLRFLAWSGYRIFNTTTTLYTSLAVFKSFGNSFEHQSLSVCLTELLMTAAGRKTSIEGDQVSFTINKLSTGFPCQTISTTKLFVHKFFILYVGIYSRGLK